MTRAQGKHREFSLNQSVATLKMQKEQKLNSYITRFFVVRMQTTWYSKSKTIPRHILA